MKISVTYSIVTPESAEHGDYAESGFIGESYDCLRDAIQDLFRTRTNEVDGIECIESSSMPIDSHSWITVYNSGEFRTGANESRSLHIDGITLSSRKRLFKLLSE